MQNAQGMPLSFAGLDILNDSPENATDMVISLSPVMI
jgi:hypothetical protein